MCAHTCAHDIYVRPSLDKPSKTKPHQHHRCHGNSIGVAVILAAPNQFCADDHNSLTSLPTRKKQQNEATPLVDAVFIEARRDNSRSNFALEKVVVVVVRQDFLSLNLGFLVI